MQPTLVILAAGVGSRYGGLKQLEPVGPGGSALMDYTIFDAQRGGFGRVVLVVRRETEALFRAHLDRGMGRKVDVKLVHQELDCVPRGHQVPESRVKPWGTGHAVMVAAEAVDGPFAVANADDYYGPDALAVIAGFLEKSESMPEGSEQWAMVGYRLGKTLPEHGSVSRGLCREDGAGWLVGLQEILKIRREGERAAWVDDEGSLRYQACDSLVSMNLWGFTRAFMDRLETGFEVFLEGRPTDTEEYLLPDAVSEAIDRGAAKVRVLSSESEWFGMTSPEDREIVQRCLADKVQAGVYPHELWSG